jgi:hypothetical protein
MKSYALLIVASAIAIVTALVSTVWIVGEKGRFDKAVAASRTTEGYDQRFIDMVNRLEDELATRARFGYTGGKDPMTGTTRHVVIPKAVVPHVRTNKTTSAPEVEPAPAAPVAAPDMVKLTAIIGDAKKMTAIVMDGERSYSVEAGDKVAGRRITRVTNEGIYMEDDSLYYFYDISGNRGTKKRDAGGAQP